jgi:Phosphotransferase enzyme family/DDE_Tnp_1-associated
MQIRKPTIRTRGHTRVPSCPTPPVDTNPTRHERLLEALEAVPDPRDRRGVRYSLAAVLALAVTATVAGCRSFGAIGQWAAETVAVPLPLSHIERSLRGSWWDRHTAITLANALSRNLHRFKELDIILQSRAATLIHGDLHPGNVLRSAQSLVILDWTDCGFGSPLWDEAMLHTNFAGYPPPPTLDSNSCRILSGVKALADLVTMAPPAPTETYSLKPQQVFCHARRIAYGLIDALDAHPGHDALNARALSSTSAERWS